MCVLWFYLLGALGRASLATYQTKSSFGIPQQLLQTCANVNVPFLPNCPQTCFVYPIATDPTLTLQGRPSGRPPASATSASEHQCSKPSSLWYSWNPDDFLYHGIICLPRHGFKALYLLGSSFSISSRPVRACLYYPTRNAPRILVEETVGQTYVLPLVGFLSVQKKAQLRWIGLTLRPNQCQVHVSLACLKSSWMDLNSLPCSGQCFPLHLYGTISPCVFFQCDSAPHFPDIISVHRSPTLHHPTSEPFSISTPAGLSFPPELCAKADLPLMIGSSLPVTPLLINPPVRSIRSTETSNHPSHVLVPPDSGCRAAICSSSLRLLLRGPLVPNPLDLWFFWSFLNGWHSPGCAHPVQLLVRWEWFLLRFSFYRRHRLNPNLIRAGHALFANFVWWPRVRSMHTSQNQNS